MLSLSSAHETRRPPLARRTRSITAAYFPTARVANLGPASLTIAVASLPTFVTVARGDSVVSSPLIVLGLFVGAVLAWGVEDPASEVLAPLPVSSPVRATIRVLFVAVVAALGVAFNTLVVIVGPGLPQDVLDRVPEAAAAASVALAVGFVAFRRGERGAGPIGVTAGLLLVGLVAALAFRWPTLLPGLGTGPTHARWWVLTAVSSGVVARAGRDP